jgi:hypothetical protein
MLAIAGANEPYGNLALHGAWRHRYISRNAKAKTFRKKANSIG